MKTLQISVLFFLVTTNLFGETFAIQTMDSILGQVKPGTMVVFDIDNTLATPPQMFGSDQWFSHIVKSNVAKGMDQERARLKALEYWQRVQMKTPLRPVEKQTVAIIKSLQARNIPVVALTARPATLAQRTYEQLRAINIDLRHTSAWKHGTTLKAKYANIMYGGVMTVGFNDKGEMLAQLIASLPEKPQHVIFVDDKQHHVVEVERALARLDLRVSTFRYGAADAYVRSFDPSIAKVQAFYFDNIMNDKAARIILHKK